MPARPASLFSQWYRASPLRHAAYRRFYVGSVGVALGYTMQATVAAWLMATLTPSPLMVALVQTASTAPALLLGLVAGSLADIVDRRRVILVTQIVLVVLTVALGAAALGGVLGPVGLLAMTFLIGAGFTFYFPTQQACVNDLVARADLSRAVALNAVAFNVSRALGPAVAGAIAAWLAPGNALLASALFFAVMIHALHGWKSPGRPVPGIPETLFSGIGTGLRYLRHSPPMLALVVHNLSFTVCASALWALLPVIARDQLELGAGGYGLLSASFGVGAVCSALLIPRALHRTSLNKVVNAGFLLWVVATLIVAAANVTAIAVVGALGAGAAWTGVLASLSAGTQTVAPAWVRARSFAMILVAVQASMAVGSALWGWLASWTDTRVALSASAGAMVALLALNRRIHVAMGDEADVTPGVQLPELTIAVPPEPDDGPVLIQLEYRIDAEQRGAFMDAMHAIEAVRRRNGASDWLVFRDLAEDGRYVERFIIRSWAEYVRLRTRMTVADRQRQDRVEQLQSAGVPVRVSRLIAVNPQDASTA